MDIKQQILHLYRVEERSMRDISRTLGVDRKTVTRLINAYEAQIRENPESGTDGFLVEDIREFTEGMEASDGERGYSLRKMKDTLGRRRVWDAALSGHCLELTVNEWSLHLFLREGILQVGWEEIPLPTFDGRCDTGSPLRNTAVVHYKSEGFEGQDQP